MPVQAEEDKWIDGIKNRLANNNNPIDLLLPWEVGSPRIIKVNADLKHLNNHPIFPIALVFPETLMNSWSYRGAVLEWQTSTELKDLAPDSGSSIIKSDTTKTQNYLS